MAAFFVGVTSKVRKLPAILFAGLPGISKRRSLEALRDYASGMNAELRHSKGRSAALTKDSIGIVEIPAYRAGYNDLTPRQLKLQMDKEINNAEKQIAAAYNRGFRLLFVYSHLSYNLNGILYSWLSASSGVNIFNNAVDIVQIITLIENTIYTRDATSKYNISISQISFWRDVEIMVADILAMSLPKNDDVRSDIMSVHQPLDSLYKNIFGKNQSRVYLAYPITQVRRMQADERKRDIAEDIMVQNIKFRKHFFERFIAFDPSAIDEVLYKFYGKGFHKLSSKKNPFTTINPSELWPGICTPEETILGVRRPSISVPTLELQEFVRSAPKTKSIALRGIRARDFRLIEQSDALVFFRPTLKGEWSHGVQEEFDYAADHSKTVCILKDDSDAELFESVASALGPERTWVKVFSGNFDDEVILEQKLAEASEWLMTELEKGKDIS